jgi:Neuraminidase-like domain
MPARSGAVEAEKGASETPASPPVKPGSPPKGPGPAEPGAVEPGTVFTVTGRALSQVLPGVAGLSVQLVDKNVGGDVVLGTTQTKPDGSYAFSQTISDAYLAGHSKTRPDLQVQVSAGNVQFGSSSVRYSAPTSISLDVVLPVNAPGLPSEYETLTANLAAVYTGSLGDLKEDATQQDITYLANKTGWDARAVALAALAEQFSKLTAQVPQPATDRDTTLVWPPPTASIAPEFYYALFRAGLPADASSLFRTPSSTVQAILQQATTQGVIPQALTKEVPAVVQSFQTLSAANILTAPPPVGVSTLQAMLGTTLTEASQQQQFAQLLAQYGGDWASFWPAAEQEFGAELAKTLQVQGQLYYLTINNEPLVTELSRVETKSPITSTLDLVELGYYNAPKWAPLISTSIPSQIPGSDQAEQAVNYAQYLAAQVRLAYPTAVVADQVRRQVLPIAGTTEVASDVVAFLTTHQGDFQIGAEPIQAYVARTGVSAPSAEAIAQIKRIQRVYQLTPDDNSLAVLLRNNLDSAFAVMRYDAAGFSRAFAAPLGGADTAALVYSRARQVHITTLSVMISYLSGRTAPPLGGQAPVQSGLPAPTPATADPSAPLTAYPTLENLFGSLDYCNCTDCGSILSPAAYLVDLLNYLDQLSPASGGDNPLDVLLGRRPDLQYLPLTCENTNTAMPYIDLVNETLEYYVANDLSMAGYQGHDTGDTITSAELVASPQYVSDPAYELLQGVLFPPPLPFNRPLMLLRLQLASLGVSLPDAMAALRSDITAPTPPRYGWNDILIEQLTISRDEYKIFTDSTQGLGKLYGLLPPPPPTAAPPPLSVLQQTSLQDFSRRLSVSYDDLILMLKTQFINPGAALIPLIEQLGTTFEAIHGLKATLNTPASTAAAFIQALPAGLDPTPYGGAAPDDYQAVVDWVTSDAIYDQIMGLVTITSTPGNGNDCSGADLQLRYANPDPAASLLSATDFLKIIRFIRLWQKLAPLLGDPDDSVTIEQTDDILAALYPAADLPVDPSSTGNDATNGPLLDKGFTTVLLQAGFVFRLMEQMALTADQSLDQLLACFAPIITVGDNALYDSMFLTPTLLQQDPGAQTATVSNLVAPGDSLTTVISKVTVGPYQVQAGETPLAVAQAIADRINAAPGLADGFTASVLGQESVITITAGFTLACQATSLTGPATESYQPAMTSPTSQSATITGPITSGDTLTTTLNGIPIAYDIPADQNAGQLASAIADAVNATTVADPGSGIPLNDLIVASSNGATISFVVASPGAPFALACSLQAGGSGSYVVTTTTPAEAQATITGNVQVGDEFVTTINSIPLPYTATANDLAAGNLAASIASVINAAVQPDSTSMPLNSEVQAAAAGDVVTITSVDPTEAFTLTCSTTSATAQYAGIGPLPAAVTATVSGAIPAGTILTTTIDTLPLPYQVQPGDTPDSISTAIASLINTPQMVDPVANMPITNVVTASANGGVVTVTSQSVTTPFTLTAAMSAAGYTAGRASPPFAPDIDGSVLQDLSQLLFSHEPTLCAAFNFTGAEFALITQALGYGPTTQLTLDAVSAVFRYGWLAHTLGISVLELLTLGKFTGLIALTAQGNYPSYPFQLPDAGASVTGEPTIVRLVGVLNALSAAGLDASQALYLMWNQDLSGTSAPATSVITGLALALRADYAAVEAQFTLQSDPDGSIANSLMTLVYGSTATDYFFGLLNNTVTTWSSYSWPTGLQALPPQIAAPSNGRLSYDNLAKQLTFAGLLDQATLGAIEAAATVNTTDSTDDVAAGQDVSFTPAADSNIYPGSPLAIDTGAAHDTVAVLTTAGPAFTAGTSHAHDGTGAPFPIVTDPAFLTALGSLATASQQALAPFFAQYPELLPLYLAYEASTDSVQDKRTALLASVLPILKLMRKQEQAMAAVTSAAGTNASLASALLQDPSVLHADADPVLPALSDMTAIENQGLSAQFFLSNDPTGTADQAVNSVPTLSYAQTITVSGQPHSGDNLEITINGTVVAYQVQDTDATLPVLAASLANAINTTPGISQVVSAAVLPPGQNGSAQGGVILLSGTDPSGATVVITVGQEVSPGGTEQLAIGTQLPGAGQPIAAIWSGFITAPQDGFYDINIGTDAGVAIALTIGGVTVAGQQQGNPNLWSNSSSISLTAGQLVPITITATSIKTTFSVSWTSSGLGWQVVPGAYLYSQNLVSRLGNSYVRFLKATSLATALSLTAPEISYLGTSTAFSVNTTSSSTTTPGAAQITPRSPANIATNSVLVIDDGTAQETITVTTLTPTGFTATTVSAHDGSANPFAVVSHAQPSVGQGWLNFLIGQGWLSSVPAQDPSPAISASLAKVLTASLDFARMKKALSPNDGRLLGVLQNPAATLPYGPAIPQPAATALPATQSALLSLTGWSLASVNALLTQFFGSTKPSSLSVIENFRRVFDAYAIVRKCRVSASTLISAITNAPTTTAVSTLQSALRALYAESDWLAVVGPINDAARIMQRDALVAYILQQEGDSYAQSATTKATTVAASLGSTTLAMADTTGIQEGMVVQASSVAPGTTVTATTANSVSISAGLVANVPTGMPFLFAPSGITFTTPDSLYEYFLIDPLTQPPVLTSRIRLALSAVQLFIERIIRNLEPLVAPGDVDLSRWESMKRYRLWQVTRELFIWPENWIYPELRDDQSPIFKQTMNTLLQGDITDDAAATAYLTYLTNLEEVAKLEPCGMWYVPGTADTNETCYVISRTSGAHRKLYFRQYQNLSWSPWTQVQIECEDMPITPIVWNGRLLLFWLKVIKQNQASGQAQSQSQGPFDTSNEGSTPLTLANLHVDAVDTLASSASAPPQVPVQAALCWTEFYNGQWQPTKTSDVNNPTLIGTYPPTGPDSFENSRSLVTIVPAAFTGKSFGAQIYGVEFTTPTNAMILAISPSGNSTYNGGFILHNTHSLPVPLDNIPFSHTGLFSNQMVYFNLSNVLDEPSHSRSFNTPPAPYTGSYGTGTFGIDYIDEPESAPDATTQILNYSWAPRVVEPQPGLQGEWTSPFIYEDRRNLFYVTSSDQEPSLAGFAGYGRQSRVLGTQTQATTIKPPVLSSPVLRPTATSLQAVSVTGMDATAMQRYLAQSADINAGLTSLPAVSYQGQVIAPIGSVAALRPSVIDTEGGVG